MDDSMNSLTNKVQEESNLLATFGVDVVQGTDGAAKDSARSSNDSNTQQSASTWKWNLFYKELTKFYKSNGHTLVPMSQEQLFKWTGEQRLQFRLFQRDLPSQLDRKRVELLEQVNFQWEIQPDSSDRAVRHIVSVEPAIPAENDPWMRQYMQLKQYCNEYGNSLVPHEYAHNPSLGRWVSKQRAQYKHWRNMVPSQLDDVRVAMLNALGFEWNPFETEWIGHYETLKEFAKEHGHCRVPFDYEQNKFLGKWVSRQRWQYKLRNDGKKSQLNALRIQLLNDIGFEWQAIASDWTKRYEELKEYMREHGHCLVPYDYEQNQQLGRWVSKQRSQYRLIEQRKPSQLTTERVDLLNKLDFQWNANEAKWMQKLQDFKSFVNRNGGRLPTHGQDQALRRWIEKQRKAAEKGIPPIRLALLLQTDFPWPHDHAKINPRAGSMHTETVQLDSYSAAATLRQVRNDPTLSTTNQNSERETNHFPKPFAVSRLGSPMAKSSMTQV